MKLTKIKTIRISESQHQTLVKMKSYKVDVGKFIREAIKEKINKEYNYLIPKENKTVNVSNDLSNLLEDLEAYS